MSDIIIFAGGIDNNVEAEGMDCMNITWFSNQLDLISQLRTLGKPVLILQMGGGQVDSSSFKHQPNIKSLVWSGSPGQSGGYALLDMLTGARAPAGRLLTTQYPADYVFEFSQDDMNLRSNSRDGTSGQTYKWYTGAPVYEFRTVLFYTNFSISPAPHQSSSKNTSINTFNISDFLLTANLDYAYTNPVPFINYTVTVTNTGSVPSDYTAILFANTTNAGPAPYSNKWVVRFDRLGIITPGSSVTLTIPVTVGSMRRYAESGDAVLYPRSNDLALSNEREAVRGVELVGGEELVLRWPSVEQQILSSQEGLGSGALGLGCGCLS